jgi:hypothetical protein
LVKLHSAAKTTTGFWGEFADGVRFRFVILDDRGFDQDEEVLLEYLFFVRNGIKHHLV